MDRKLTTQEVISMIQKINIPISRIEKDLGIPTNILSRAAKENTKKPLPKKYEDAFISYVNNFINGVKNSQHIEIQRNEPKEIEKENKLFWLNSIRVKKGLAPI